MACVSIQSIVIATDISVGGDTCSVTARDGVTVVETPSRPHFYWGNYLVMAAPAMQGDLASWEMCFEAHLPGYSHRAFTWYAAQDDYKIPEDFAAAGYEIDTVVALTAQVEHVAETQRSLPEGMRVIDADARDDALWRSLVDLATITRPAGFRDHSFFLHARDSYAVHRDAIRQGRARWLLAVSDHGIAGAMGVYECPEGRARYQDVMTHPAFRRQGVATALLTDTALAARSSWNSRELVIVAEDSSDAQRLYERVGFAAAERADGITLRPAQDTG